MSTFTNTTTNITAPLESCSYVGYTSPPGNDTLVSCAVPDCDDNRFAFEKCCMGGSVTTFNQTRPVPQRNITINTEYLVCTVDEDLSGFNFSTRYNPSDPFFSLPDCIVRNGGSRLLCNQPNTKYNTCPGPNGIETPEGTGTGFATCSVNNQNENLTAALTNCCSSSNGTIRAEQGGCAVSCSGDDTLEPCLVQTFRTLRYGFGAGYICGNNTKTGGVGSLGGSGRTTLASVLLAAVAMVAMLQ